MRQVRVVQSVRICVATWDNATSVCKKSLRFPREPPPIVPVRKSPFGVFGYNFGELNRR